MNSLKPFATTVVGSFPHQQADGLSRCLVDCLDVPAWPQLPRRSFKESIYVQYSASLPGIVVNEGREKVFFDTSADITPALECFYGYYLADDLQAFRLTPEYSQGFFAMLEALREAGPGSGWAKGQVMGPVSFGLTITDQELRASLYNELLADAIVKNMAMNARWQVRQLKALRPETILFVDEPYMASFGSAFVSLSREGVIEMLDEVFSAIHAEGAVSGVHCCANTDWSVLLGTQVQILNLDAYGFIENLALYPAELRAYLDRGGLIAWGLVPNHPGILDESAESLVDRLRQGIRNICDKARARGVKITEDELADRSLIVPSCGLGSTDVATAEAVLERLVEVGEVLRMG